jgi:hypothetical protein
MAKGLIGEANTALLSLDDIAWNPGPQRKPLAESLALLDDFLKQNDSWVIEGCYGDLIEAALPHCDELRFLNPGLEACLLNCKQRPWEPDKFESPAAQEAMLNTLIAWVKEYDTRTDEYGLQRHRRIFEAFIGAKREYRSLESYFEQEA